MGVTGVGTDIIEVDRIQRAISNSGKPFLDKIFTETEQSYCDSQKDRFQHYAARFAAKEAILKSLKMGWDSIDWTNIEIQKTEAGAPVVYLREELDLEVPQDSLSFNLSLSHHGDYAVAFAVTEKEAVS